MAAFRLARVVYQDQYDNSRRSSDKIVADIRFSEARQDVR